MADPFDALLGNGQQKKFFRGEIESGTLAHAYILEGPQGSGRHTLALSVAKALAGGVPGSEKIERGISPDVKIFGLPQDRKIFTVDLVRRLREDAFVKPNELPFRFYILENAECMNAQAQNAALKLLEEPPGDTRFFLLCENAAALLPTVRSRAPVIRMQRFSVGELGEMLAKTPSFAKIKEDDPERFESAVKNSGGSYGKAVLALEKSGEKGEKVFRGQADRLLACIAPPNRVELLCTVLAFPSKRQEFEEILELLQLAFRDMILVRYGNGRGTPLYFSSKREAENAARGLTGRALLSLFEKTTLVRENLRKNVNIQGARMTLAHWIYDAAAN